MAAKCGVLHRSLASGEVYRCTLPPSHGGDFHRDSSRLDTEGAHFEWNRNPVDLEDSEGGEQ